MGEPSNCPFCGNRYTAVKSGGYYDGEYEVPWFQVVCHKCEARGPRTYGVNGYELAMVEWNRAGRLESIIVQPSDTLKETGGEMKWTC